MKKFLLLVTLILSYFSAISQTKIHDGFTEASQEKWVATMQAQFPFEFSDQQWDAMIVLHEEFCKSLGTRTAKKFEKSFVDKKSEHIPYLEIFYPVLSTAQVEEMKKINFDNMKSAKISTRGMLP